MTNENAKQKKGESASTPGEPGACETNTDRSGKGSRKPECPDGYAEEQPSEEQAKEKQPKKK